MGVTPDPIPNSEVKPHSADGTAGEALWESRTPPDFFFAPSPLRSRGFFLLRREPPSARETDGADGFLGSGKQRDAAALGSRSVADQVQRRAAGNEELGSGRRRGAAPSNGCKVGGVSAPAQDVDARDSKDGRPVFNRTVTLRDSWARIEKKLQG